MNLLEVKKPTISQLIYMKDLYSKDILIEYMSCKWEYKFNHHMSKADWEQFNLEIKYLNLDRFIVLSSMEDYYLI